MLGLNKKDFSLLIVVAALAFFAPIILNIFPKDSALSFFNVSNRVSFSLLFGQDLYTEAGQAGLKAQVAETVLRFVARR